jgi:two-component system NtrC family sensor kinase
MPVTSPLRVLVIEDDASLREAEIRMLQRNGDGWEVGGAASMAEAVQALEAGSHQVALLDLNLPDAKDLQGLERLRQVHPQVAIVVVTGETDESKAFSALAAGAQEYLVKGQYDGRTLHRTVRYALERKRAELDLMNSTLLLASTLDSFHAAVGILGKEGRIYATNAPWRTGDMDNPFVGRSGPGTDYRAVCEALGDSPVLETAVVAKGILAVLEGRIPTFKVEYPIEGSSVRWFGLTASGFRIEGAVHVLIAIRDITDRMRITAELRKNQHFFKIITEHATDLMAIVDRTGKRLYESPSYQKSLGWSKEELDAMDPLSLVHPDDWDATKQALESAFRTGAGSPLIYRMLTKSGTYRTFESHSAVVRDPQGDHEAVLFSARDVTARREAEEERDRMEVQLRAAQKLESIGQLAAGIAHEINTPIQYIGDNTRFLRDSFDDFMVILARQRAVFTALDLNSLPEDLMRAVPRMLSDSNFEYLIEEIPRAAEETLEGVDRVAKIIKALKEFSYPMGEDPVMMDVNKGIETTLTVARNEWKYHAEAELDLDPHLPFVPGFPGEFNQVVLNLVVNAVHAIQDVLPTRGVEKGVLKIRTSCVDDFVQVEIEDNGNGIPPEVQPRIFDPFFTTKAVGKGTGQGLSIAHAVMEKHQGSIVFRTAVGQGTTFILRLPQRRQEEKGVVA